MRFTARALTVAAYAVAMAYVEAAVVVDLNGALGQQVGVLFPLRPEMTSGPLRNIEMGREAATMVMLATVGLLAGRGWVERLAWSAVAFGVWDIGYYGWLHLFTGWPPSLGTWDVLFLVPLPWTSPVWAPAAASVALVAFGLAVAHRLRTGDHLHVSSWHLAAGLIGALLVILSFTAGAPAVLAGAVPDAYAWPLLAAGLILAGGAALDVLRGPERSLLPLRSPDSSP